MSFKDTFTKDPSYVEVVESNDLGMPTGRVKLWLPFVIRQSFRSAVS